LTKFHGNILSLSKNIAESFRGRLLILTHVGPFHLRDLPMTTHTSKSKPQIELWTRLFAIRQ